MALVSTLDFLHEDPAAEENSQKDRSEKKAAAAQPALDQDASRALLKKSGGREGSKSHWEFRGR